MLEEVLCEGEAYEGAAVDWCVRELVRIFAVLKREVVCGEHVGVELRELLFETVCQCVSTLVSLGVGVVLFDECYYFVSLWGYVVRVVFEELLGGVHVIGFIVMLLVSLFEDDCELYDSLFGLVDFIVFMLVVVCDGYLVLF